VGHGTGTSHEFLGYPSVYQITLTRMCPGRASIKNEGLLSRDVFLSRGLVITNAQANRAIWKISLPILRRLRVERQVRVRREVLW
jgi:hypothetical protein